MLHTTVGQLLINEALPEDLRDYNRVFDKKGAKELLRQVAEQHPEKYRDVSFRLSTIGRRVSQETGGYSFGLEHMRKSVAGVKTRQRIQAKLQQLLDDDDLDDKGREELIVKLAGREMKPQQEAIYAEALAAKNPLAMQVLSGTRGNKMNLASMLGSDLLYSDHHDRPIPVPVLRSYAEGLSPEEYWAGAYGARKGTIATKFATQDAGFFGKQLNQVAHRLVVVDEDYDDEEQRKLLRGVPTDTDDMDNEGALLALDVGPYKKNTTLTPKILKHLKRLGKDRILVRSAMVGGSPEGGVYARDAGVRERGYLPGRGEQIGLTAAQAISEPVSQGQLSAKHSGGVAGEEKAVSGFEYLNQLVQVPKHFKGGAAHSRIDGTVQRIEPAPAGGTYVTVDGEQHYVGKGFDLKVKKGDTIEAGDVLSEGIPNPAEITRYKGIGEGRRYFTKAMVSAMRDMGMTSHRRNVELLARGLINHVRLTDEYQDFVPDDVIPYSTLEHTWKPRDGHVRTQPRQAVGKYLEAPVLHYTLGSKITPSMIRDLDEFGVQEVVAHDQEPPFQPEMVRAMASLQHDPDWMAKMYGSNLKKGLLGAVHRGGTSQELGTSFVPSLAKGVEFGRQPGAVVHQPGPGFQPTLAPDPEEQRTLPAAGTISAPKQHKPVSSQKWFGGRFKLSPFGQKAASFEKRADGIPVPPGNASSTVAAPPSVAPPAAGRKPFSYTSAPNVSGPGGGYQAAAAQTAGKMRQGPPPGTPAPYSNPYAWGGGAFSSSNMINSPFAGPMIGAMNDVMPGMGGVVGLGTMLNSQAMATLMGGKRSPIYGAAGYAPPDEDYGQGGQGTGYFGGAGGWGSGAGGFYDPSGGAPPEAEPAAGGSMDVDALMRPVDNFFDAVSGTTPGTGYFGSGPVNVRDALPQGMRDVIPDVVEDTILRYTPNPLNPSRTALGPAAALRNVLRPITAPLGRAISPLWRLPTQGAGYLPWIRNTGVGKWLQGVKTFAPKATQQAGWLTRLMQSAPLLKNLPKIPKGAGGALNWLNIGLDAAGVGYDEYKGRQQYQEGDRVDRSLLDWGASDRTLAGEQYAAKQVQDRRQALAESTDNRIGNTLGLVGEFFSPVSTATQAKQLVTETEMAAKELTEQAGENYRVGARDMERHMQGGPNPTYNPLNENNLTYQSIGEMYEKMDERSKARREAGVLLPGFLDAQDWLATNYGTGAEAALEWSKLKGAVAPVLERQQGQEDERMQLMEKRVRDLERRARSGEVLNAGQQSDIERFNQLKQMTTYQRLNEGKGMGERATEDIMLLPMAMPGAQDVVLPGQSWGVRRFASIPAMWRSAVHGTGEATINPIFWRSGDTYEDQMKARPRVSSPGVPRDERRDALQQEWQNRPLEFTIDGGEGGKARTIRIPMARPRQQSLDDTSNPFGIGGLDGRPSLGGFPLLNRGNGMLRPQAPADMSMDRIMQQVREQAGMPNLTLVPEAEQGAFGQRAHPGDVRRFRVAPGNDAVQAAKAWRSIYDRSATPVPRQEPYRPLTLPQLRVVPAGGQ